ncbi:MAG TPA: ATP-binding protein [Candidatus Limnocylindrales bacterium]|nr:ATP-binding protein [Candidatus Limnocylindrales bacterium]
MHPTILVVEDDETLRTLVMELLMKEQFHVVTARTGVEALELLKNGLKPDLIISDIIMPEMDGYELYQRVHNHQNLIPIPFIFLTAKTGEEEIRQGKSLGVDEYITKPFKLEDLIIAVRARLKRTEEFRKGFQDPILEKLEDLQNLLRITAHELKTPIASIESICKMLMTESMTEADRQQFLHMLQNQTIGLKELVKDLLELNYLETTTSKEKLEKEKIFLLELINLGISGTSELKTPNHRIKIEISEPNLWVYGNKFQLRLVLTNLLSNAIKYSFKGGDILIRVENIQEDKKAKISVIDNGIGIDEANLPYIFDKFYRIKTKETENIPGTGLGLTIVKYILDLHDTKPEIKSIPGKGTHISFTLPICQT